MDDEWVREMSLMQSSTESFFEKENRHKCPGISEIELSKKDLYFQNILPFSNSAGCLYVLVTQLCLTLCHPMDCSPPGSSVHGDSLGKNAGVVCHTPSRGSEPRSPTFQADSLPFEPPGQPKNTGVGSLSFLQGNFLTQESNQGFLQCRQILY